MQYVWACHLSGNDARAAPLLAGTGASFGSVGLFGLDELLTE